MDTDRIGCVLMASGMGRRFGGNKLIAEFHGEPMIARTLNASASFSHRVVVTRHEDVACFCRKRGIPVVLHALPYRSDTVRLGLEALIDMECCIFCPCDQPLLTADTLLELVQQHREHPECILRPSADGQPGAPILFPKTFFPELLSLPQGKGGSFVAKKHPEQVRFVPIRDAYELMDADTPEALQILTNHAL